MNEVKQCFVTVDKPCPKTDDLVEATANLCIKKRRGTPSGGQMFDKAMTAFRPNGRGVRGTWWGGGNLADNFNAFKAAIRNGLTPEQAAFKTFTGHMAEKYGFKTAKIVTNDSSKVVVEFTKEFNAILGDWLPARSTEQHDLGPMNR
ncbi:MAG: hypothetical protein WD049_07315 [Candidatus Paceibacterota bacterium]